MSNATVVIVRKKRRGHHGHHGGAWKVAYADFVTAMMAFFLVMWIVGQSAKVRSGVAGYFRQPGLLGSDGNGVLPGNAAGIGTEGPKEVLKIDKQKEEEAEIDAASLERSAQRIRERLSKLPEFERLKGQIEITATSEGLRIELIDSGEATFFDTGSAILKPATERILTVIGRELSSLARPVVVEGHTDSRPYSRGDGYTNWELSADRANAARRQMEHTGLTPALVRAVRGFADKQLANRANPLDSRNRRVTILVVAHVTETKTER
jgi:chemotaxis protein MotB